MKSLAQMFANHEIASNADFYDILLMLLRKISEFGSSMITPETVLINADHDVSVAADANPDYAYAAPEVIFSNAAVGEPQHQFALGALMVFMDTGRSPYDLYEDGVLAFSGVTSGCVAPPASVYDGPLSNIARQLTSLDPQMRRTGVSAFLTFLGDNVPGAAQVTYTHNGRTVASQKFSFTKLSSISLDGYTFSAGGNQYQVSGVTLAYRPGTHEYTVEAKPKGGSAARQPSAPAAGTAAQKKYVLATSGANGNYIRLFALNDKAAEKTFPIFFGEQRDYPVYKMTEDANGHLTEVAKNGFYVYAHPGHTRGVLKLSVPAKSSMVTVSVLDASKTKKLQSDIVFDAMSL